MMGSERLGPQNGNTELQSSGFLRVASFVLQLRNTNLGCSVAGTPTRVRVTTLSWGSPLKEHNNNTKQAPLAVCRILILERHVIHYLVLIKVSISVFCAFTLRDTRAHQLWFENVPVPPNDRMCQVSQNFTVLLYHHSTVVRIIKDPSILRA